jgi:hypothetical protein
MILTGLEIHTTAMALQISSLVKEFIGAASGIDNLSGVKMVYWDNPVKLGGNNKKANNLQLKARTFVYKPNERGEIPQHVHVHRCVSNFDDFIKEVSAPIRNILIHQGEETTEITFKDLLEALSKASVEGVSSFCRFFVSEKPEGKRYGIIYVVSDAAGTVLSNIVVWFMIDEISFY